MCGCHYCTTTRAALGVQASQLHDYAAALRPHANSGAGGAERRFRPAPELAHELITLTVLACPCCGEPVCPRCGEEVDHLDTGRCEICGVALDDDDDVLGSWLRS